jgi:hypothetical protein
MMKRCGVAKSSGDGHTFQKLVLLPHDTFQHMLAKSDEAEARIEALSRAKTLMKNQVTGQIGPITDQQRERLAMIRNLENTKVMAAREQYAQAQKRGTDRHDSVVHGSVA